MTSPASPERVAVGRIASAHGVRGWLKVQPYSESGTVLLSAKAWWLTAASAVQGAPGQALRVLACRAAGPHLLAQLEGISDRDAAQALRGQMIWVDRAEFPAADPDEYYWIDLIGCRLYGMSGGSSVLLGEVDEVFDNGAHAVLQVVLGDLNDSSFCPSLGRDGRPQHTLIPFVAAHVQRVDLQSRRIDTDWPADF
ncbi:MAG TPA: ribosome maturation factor RimM [Castellaniella sp.]|uniref:ribosome maturation factor RimM n=1 Tax=Castellaniella sp. TaxID=1955812 RepID=UPI002F14DD09